MARLIPSFMDDRTPPGERDVFNLLAAGPDDWVALHSLDLAPWNRSLRTEIDFVVIVPDTGIVCVEVKSHELISFAEGRWYPPDINRSPFKQAADGRHTFYRRLRDLLPELKRVPVVHCCIFPRAYFDVQPNMSVQPWELIDARRFRAFSSGHDFAVDLKQRMTSSIRADGSASALGSRLSPCQIERIVSACLPVQKCRADAREQIAKREEESDRILREQQKPVLKLVALNERVVISGGAGTGKTLIAMEVARRAADKGARVGLFCFNQLVGDWMKGRMDEVLPRLPNLIVGRAIRAMAELAGLEFPAEPGRDYWDVRLPEELEGRLTDPEFRAVAAFDFLVVDEAQDLLARPRLWECLTQFLAGGVERGKFALFGDFDNQVLAERGAMGETQAMLEARAQPTRWHLSENCRNYRIVGDTAVRLSGLGYSVYSGYMRSGGSIQNYDIAFYESEHEQLERIGQWLREFRALGYKESEITILSFRADHLSAAAGLKHAGHKLRPVWQAGDRTSYASVQAFKGMENKIVILTDVVLTDRDFGRDLFYTGMTRATESVRVSCDKASQETLRGWLVGKADE